MLKHSLNYGAILGISIVGLTYLSYLLGFSETRLEDFLFCLILVVVLIYGIKNYRNQVLNGYIDYGKSLGLGTLISAGAGIIFSFFLYLYLNFVDSSMVMKLYELQEQHIYNDPSLSDEEIELALKYLKMTMKPSVVSISGFFTLTFIGFIFSLIISFFLKKPEPFFESE